jgi:hypothetical protein
MKKNIFIYDLSNEARLTSLIKAFLSIEGIRVYAEFEGKCYFCDPTGRDRSFDKVEAKSPGHFELLIQHLNDNNEAFSYDYRLLYSGSAELTYEPKDQEEVIYRALNGYSSNLTEQEVLDIWSCFFEAADKPSILKYNSVRSGMDLCLQFFKFSICSFHDRKKINDFYQVKKRFSTYFSGLNQDLSDRLEALDPTDKSRFRSSFLEFKKNFLAQLKKHEGLWNPI